jgi:SSS family solute:Na+ symporter
MLALHPGPIAAISLPSPLAFAAMPLARLCGLDIAVSYIYFAMVIWIGFYMKGKSNTGEDFFPAGREMIACTAGRSFF